MRNYKAQGIVLNTIKYGESSLVAYVLTDTAGRESFLVQGVGSSKRGKSGKAALFQPMFLIEFEGLETSHSTMHRIREARLSEPLQNIPFDVRKSTIALFMAEVLYKLIKEVEPDSPLFEFVKMSVLALDVMESGISNFHLWFLVGLSRYLGFYPANEYGEGDFFDIEEGSFTPLQPRSGLFINRDNSELLHRLQNCSASDLGDIALSRRQRSDFASSLLLYFGYHLESINRIQSIKILSEVF